MIMKNFMKTILQKSVLVLFLLSSIHLGFAQDSHPDLEQIFYKAYCNSNVQLWQTGIQQLKQEYEQSKDPQILLALAQAETGLIGTYMGKQQMEKAEDITDEAEKHLEKALKSLDNNSDVHALYAGVLGFQIAFSPMKGMFLGSKSEKHIETAMNLEGENPIAWYEQGASYYHTPSMFGGDVGKAVECFEKAVRMHEKEAELDFNWQYLDALTWLGQAYLKHEQKDKAIATFKKCLEIAPDFQWVKWQLLPLAEKS